MRYRLEAWHIALAAVLVLALSLMAIAVFRFKLPFSWDVWYHVRMGDLFKEGLVWWDWGSFGPTGRPNLYSPGFHMFLAGLSLFFSASTQTIARYLPLVMYPLTIGVFYWLISLLYDRETAIISAALAITIPVSVDRGVISSSQALATIFMLLVFIFFFKSLDNRKWAFVAGAFGAAVVLTHGLTLIVTASVVLLFTLFLILNVRHDKDSIRNILLILGVFIIVSAIIPSYWIHHLLGHGIYSRLPESIIIPLKSYPNKLGALQLGLACIGLGWVVTRRRRSEQLVFSWFLVTFALSTSMFWILPSRFIEFMALPVAALAGIAIKRMILSNRLAVGIGICGLILVSLAGPYMYMHSISPLVYEHEGEAFTWLGEETIVDGQVITGWFFAPVCAAISHKVPIKGAYYSGSFNYNERTKDTNSFYRGDPAIVEKYLIRYVYFGRKELYDYKDDSFLNECDLFNKTYSGATSNFYCVLEE